jgi:hypothetical protein
MPTIDTYTSWGDPARDAAWTRFRVASTSPLLLVAQCTMAAVPSTAAATPSPVRRSPVRYRMPSVASRRCRVSTRTSQPASRSRRTTSRPRRPVPPVTRTGDGMASPVSSRVLLITGEGMSCPDGPASLPAPQARRRSPRARPACGSRPRPRRLPTAARPRPRGAGRRRSAPQVSSTAVPPDHPSPSPTVAGRLGNGPRSRRVAQGRAARRCGAACDAGPPGGV